MKRIEVVRQSEATECGLACLVMIAQAKGVDVSLVALRRVHGVSPRGMTLRAIMNVATQIGLKARPLRLELEAMRYLKLPALLHWDMDHYVVLEAVTANRAVLIDPARGRLEISISELAAQFTGIALEFEGVSLVSIPGNRKLNLRDLVSGAKGLNWAFGQVIALALITQIFYLILPLYVQSAVDSAIPSRDKSLLIVLAGAFGAFYMISIVANAVRSWIAMSVGNRMMLIFHQRTFAHLIRLPLSWFDRRLTGEILSRLDSQRPIQEILTNDAPGALLDLVICIMIFLIIISYSIFLSIITTTYTILSLAIVAFTYPALKRSAAAVIAAGATEHAIVLETLRAIRPIKVFGREVDREAIWWNRFSSVIGASVIAGRLQIYIKGAKDILSAMEVMASISVGSILVMDGRGITAGMLVAFIFYRQVFSEHLQSLLQRLSNIKLAAVHLERLSDILENEPENSRPLLPSKSLGNGEVKVSGVRFAYSFNDPEILKGVDFEVDKGETIAIVGATGNGKSTLVRILAGLERPTAGSVFVSGVDLSGERSATRNSDVAVVLQDDLLFNGSIADNISLFDPFVDMDRVRSVAEIACVDADIQLMPMQYWTWIGDMGASLSGGQRQRLLVARALYARPGVLMMDEGTANLDLETEAKVAENLMSLDITRVFVSHRPALVMRSNRVLELKGGKITELSKDQIRERF